jgi:hypothetical protein
VSDGVRTVLTLLIFLAAVSMCVFINQFALLFQAAARRVVGPDASVRTWRVVGISLIAMFAALLVAAAYFLNR